MTRPIGAVVSGQLPTPRESVLSEAGLVPLRSQVTSSPKVDAARKCPHAPRPWNNWNRHPPPPSPRVPSIPGCGAWVVSVAVLLPPVLRRTPWQKLTRLVGPPALCCMIYRAEYSTVPPASPTRWLDAMHAVLPTVPEPLLEKQEGKQGQDRLC